LTRPPEYLKLLANRLAEAAASSNGARLMQLLQQAGLLGVQEEKPRAQKPGSIGIWEPKTKGGRVSYVRSLDKIADWPRWANIARIDPKHTRWRILFLGESVARGYLYEPFYTPAIVLQSLLEGVLGKNAVEVIDLARTDMATEITDLAISAAALEPDGIVVFAGNNWRAGDLLSESRRPELDAILRSQGIAQLKEFAEQSVRSRARAVVEQIRDFYSERKVPVVWAIPEFNLGDWVDWRTNAPFLHGSANSEWFTCCQEAEDALSREDFATAERLAQRMLELDERTTTYTLTILARCRLHAGDVRGARTYLEQATDARMWDSSQLLSPRCLAVTREEIKAHGQSGTSTVADLRELYREHMSNALPDRRLFLDYCHLTIEGIRVSMAAVAARLAIPLSGRVMDWCELFTAALAPTAAVEAEGSLLAAVHNAHWFQPQPLIEYFCSHALQVSPHTADIMMRFIELQTTPTPALLSQPAERMSELGGQAVEYLLGRINIQQLDVVLLTSMASALEKAGRPAHTMLKQHWIANHDASERTTDLLDFYYLSSADQPQELFWAKRDAFRTSPAPAPESLLQEWATPNYYRAYWIESIFVFIARGDRCVQFDLTCRIPDAVGSAETIKVFVNDKSVADLKGERAWRKHTIQTQSSTLREGLNYLRIHWPMRNDDPRAKLTAAADSLVHLAVQPLFVQPLFQIFGEIHSLTASPAQECQEAGQLQDELNS
jgi:hypothetical protein